MIYVAPLALIKIPIQNQGLHPWQVYFAPSGLKGQIEMYSIQPVLLADWICRLVAGVYMTSKNSVIWIKNTK